MDYLFEAIQRFVQFRHTQVSHFFFFSLFNFSLIIESFLLFLIFSFELNYFPVSFLLSQSVTVSARLSNPRRRGPTRLCHQLLRELKNLLKRNLKKYIRSFESFLHTLLNLSSWPLNL